jgi:hypothetical protein
MHHDIPNASEALAKFFFNPMGKVGFTVLFKLSA